MDLNKKTLIPIVAMGLIAIISCILFFFPNLVGYDKSYVAINEKKELALSNNEKLANNEKEIALLKETLESTKKNAESEDKRADEYEEKVNKDDLVLNIPKFLIKMEQEAIKSKVKLDIDYAAMSSSQPGAPQPETEDTSKEGTVQPGTETPQTGTVQPGTETPQTGTVQPGTEDNSGISEQEKAPGIVHDSGLQTTTIPIEISGSYSNVRKYILFLDEVGLINPTTVSLKSNGKKIDGKINLNIIHGEVNR